MNAVDPAGLSVDLAGVAQWAADHWASGDNGFGDDCADFVSRSLHFGGDDPETYSWDFLADATHKHDVGLWYQVSDSIFTETSFSWANAQDLAEHFLDNGSTELAVDVPLLSPVCQSSWREYYALPSDIEPGDIAFANWSGSQFAGITHAGVIIAVGQGTILIAQHTPDKLDDLTVWAHFGPDPHLWIFRPSQG